MDQLGLDNVSTGIVTLNLTPGSGPAALPGPIRKGKVKGFGHVSDHDGLSPVVKWYQYVGSGNPAVRAATRKALIYIVTQAFELAMRVATSYNTVWVNAADAAAPTAHMIRVYRGIMILKDDYGRHQDLLSLRR